MIALDELKTENQELEDLYNVIAAVMEMDELRGNPVVCGLINNFNEKLMAHLIHEDREAYPDILHSHDANARHMADLFMGNTHELLRLFKSYKNRWCHTENRYVEDSFLGETKEMFRLARDRINLEKNKLFPALESAL